MGVALIILLTLAGAIALWLTYTLVRILHYLLAAPKAQDEPCEEEPLVFCFPARASAPRVRGHR